MQKLALPAALVEVEHGAGLLEEGRVDGEDPGAVLPGLERILGEPARDRRGRGVAHAPLDDEPVQPAREKRESGMPCSRGSSQAIAFTRATSSGGKTARAARALQVLESFEPLVAETSSPASHRLPRHPQPLADLDVRPALGRQEHQPRPLHLPVRVGVAGRAVLELGPLDLAEHDLMGAASRHRPAISPRLSSLLQARWDF